MKIPVRRTGQKRLDQPTKREIAKLATDAEQATTFLKSRKNSMMDQLANGSNVDGVSLDLTVGMLSAIVDALPTLEANLKGPKGVYPFVNLVTATRELIHDLRTMQDRSAIRKAVIEDVIAPSIVTLVRDLNTSINHLGKVAKRELGPNAEMNEAIEHLKTMIEQTANASYKSAVVSLNRYLGGIPEEPRKLVSEDEAEEGDVYVSRK